MEALLSYLRRCCLCLFLPPHWPLPLRLLSSYRLQPKPSFLNAERHGSMREKRKGKEVSLGVRTNKPLVRADEMASEGTRDSPLSHSDRYRLPSVFLAG